MGKERHNIMIDNQVWAALQELKRLKGKSMSFIMEKAVKNYLKSNKYNNLYFKLMNTVPFCDNRENEEITEMLEQLTEENLEITDKFEV